MGDGRKSSISISQGGGSQRENTRRDATKESQEAGSFQTQLIQFCLRSH